MWKNNKKNKYIIYTILFIIILFSLQFLPKILNKSSNIYSISINLNDKINLQEAILFNPITTVEYKGRKEIAQQKYLEEQKNLKEEQEKLKISTITNRSFENRNSEEYILFNASAYCSCIKCCGKTNGITASGTKATKNRTVAMSNKYAFGTKIEIKGYGIYICEDRGGAIQNNKIDIFFNTHQEALNFGRKNVYIKILN